MQNLAERVDDDDGMYHCLSPCCLEGGGEGSDSLVRIAKDG